MNGRNPSSKPYQIAILWRGDREARRTATPENNRFYRVFEELAALGIQAEPAVYDEAFADDVREQLLAADGVLVWVDPIHQGKTAPGWIRCCATSPRAALGSALTPT
jgi:hypothetical protein